MFLQIKTVETLLRNSQSQTTLNSRGRSQKGKEMNWSTELSSCQVRRVSLGLIRDNMLKQEGPQGFLSCKVFFPRLWALSPWRTQALTSRGTPFGRRTMTLSTGGSASERFQPHRHSQPLLRDGHLGRLHGQPFPTTPRQPPPSQKAT